MRVGFNQWAAAGRKTGIGHYVAELVRLLPGEARADDIFFFPPPWMQTLKARLAGGYGYRPSVPGGAAKRSLLGLLRGGARGLMRRAGLGFVAWRFRRFCTRHGLDVYHEPNYVPLPCDLPTVVTVHDLSVLLHPEWHPPDRVAHHERHFRDAVRRCRHFLTVSDFTRQEMIRALGVAPERVTRVYNGIRPNLTPLPPSAVAGACRRLGLPERYFVHVGTIEPRKNLLLLLRAYCGLPAQVRDRWPLVLVGGWGWQAQPVFDFWHSEARHRGVLHIGYVADEDLPAVYNGARALLCPSLYEGFGLPPVEMLACGGAVIASTAAALVETAGRQAHLIAPEDEAGWRDAMARVAEEDAWWQALRRGGVETASAFTWQRCAAGTWAVYRKVHEGGGVAAALPSAA